MPDKCNLFEGWNLELDLLENFLVNSGWILEGYLLKFYFSTLNFLDSIRVSAVDFGDFIPDGENFGSCKLCLGDRRCLGN